MKHIPILAKQLFIAVFTAGCMLFATNAKAQQPPKVTQKVDTTAIKIGQQINYKVVVEADSTANIIFPEGQTFSPMEMVEASDIDTVKGKDTFTWIRNYALSQFDSGAYYIPPQRIVVNAKPYMLDSIPVSVSGVVVDTTKQKMYNIKGLTNVEKASNFNWILWLWILIPLAIIAFIVWWFVFRKKPLTEEEKIALLPPFERAIQELKNLEKSRYIIESNYKGYYSELTTIVKRYLEDEVHISAMESTTDELFAKIEMLQASGSMHLDNETIRNFKRVLQTADLVKFARSKPADNQANTDRKVIEEVVVETKESLPEPTKEELAETEEYKKQMLKRKKKRKIVIAVVASVSVVFVAAGGAIAYYGFTFVKDTILGHETKELLEGAWVTSEYGIPPIKLDTPMVLSRVEVKIPEGQDTIIKSNKTFQYGSLLGSFYVAAGTVKYQPGIQPDINTSIQNRLKIFEQQGLQNMLTKQEDFVSKDGVTGVKVYGTASFPPLVEGGKRIDGAYELIEFGGNDYEQLVIIAYREEDTYAQKIVEKIEGSIEVNTNVISTTQEQEK